MVSLSNHEGGRKAPLRADLSPQGEVKQRHAVGQILTSPLGGEVAA
jgi:hypothetical protein